MSSLPRAARLTCWANAWLAGATSLEEAVEQIRADDAAHHLLGLPGEQEPTSLLLGLGALRKLGTRCLHLALPAPGDPLGLAGPPPFTESAVEAGEAVVCEPLNLGAVPLVAGAGVQWQVRDAVAPPPAAVPEADRELTEALHTAIDELTRLDIARHRPEVADELADPGLGSRDETLPPGYPPRAERLASRGRRCLGICRVIARAEPGALTLAEGSALDTAMRPLERAARRALVAACGPYTG